MLHLLIAILIALHGIGHVAGFWLAVPPWFAAVWALPGVGYVLGAWAYWQGEPWWAAVVAISALGSVVVLTFPTGVLRLRPFRSALAFDLVIVAAVLAPWTRDLMAGL